jgi:catechol 2,3-dioxygenase-like lactoylglutathione lyase family enzyme
MQKRIKHIGRYALAALLALAAGMAGAQNAALPDYTGFDHLVIDVDDLGRSRDFYTRLFGFGVWRLEGEDRYLVLGSTYLRLREGASARVAQIGIGVRDFTPEPLRRHLEREGLPWRAGADGGELAVTDGDGVRSVLLAEQSWQRLRQGATALPAPKDAPAPIFKPLRLDEVGLSVSSLEVDSLFYARLLARGSTLQAGSLWYTFGGARLRLAQTPVGQKPGVDYFSILISNTDLEAAANAVFAAGGIIEILFPNGFSFWDPDGLRVVVHTTPMF